MDKKSKNNTTIGMKVCLLLLVSIIFVVVVHGDDDDMMRRKQYLKMVKLRKNQMEASREAFEKSTTDTESIDTGSTKESIHIQGLRTRSVVEVTEAPSVVDFFKRYELKSEPLRVRAEAFKSTNANKNVPPPRSCYGGVTANSKECVQWRDQYLDVPSYVINDYAQRCSDSTNFQWPEAFPSRQTQPSQIERLTACPYDMHQLLWIDTSSSEEESRLHVALLDNVQKTFAYGDFSFSYAGDFRKVDIFRPDLATYPLLKRASVSVTELKKGDALFIPSGWLVAVNDVSASSSNLIWRHCFVDASNLNLVEASLRVESLVSKDAQKFHDVLNRVAGRQTLSTTTTTKDDDDRNEEEEEEVKCHEDAGLRMWQSMTSERRNMIGIRHAGLRGISPQERLNVLRLGHVGQSRFGHWQQLQSWQNLIRKHTVALPAAYITRLGPDFCVLRWYAGTTTEKLEVVEEEENNNILEEEDVHSVIAGYRVVWELADSPHADHHDAAKLEPEDSTTGAVRLRYFSSSKGEENVLIQDGEDDNEMMKSTHCVEQHGRCFADDAEDLEEENGEVTVVLKGFRPGHTYQLHVLPFVLDDDDNNDDVVRTRLEPMLAVSFTTFASHPSYPPIEPPLSIDVEPKAVHLRWKHVPEHLRGGLPIEEYVVERRLVSREEEEQKRFETETGWTDPVHFKGSLSNAWIEGLMPGKKYMFRVAASNSRGIGTFLFSFFLSFFFF
ncbi:fibronectin type III domain-containing protein [bacterium]|nr:fibronectin type III domain-containing protein [bacterium]